MTILQSAKARAILKSCQYQLWDRSLSPRDFLTELARQTSPALSPDFYGQGKLIQSFEAKIARWSGKEAALFLPSGILAQQIALKIWSDKKSRKNIGVHPLSHLQIHELNCLRKVHGLRPINLCPKAETLRAKHLKACKNKLGALAIELPLRELGGLLPSFSELKKLSQLARQQRIPLHCDGARLWESIFHFNKKPKTICALFDSLYLSFYKGLKGLAGAALCGDKKFIAEARKWQRRLGGNLIHLYPYVLAADLGFEKKRLTLERKFKQAQVIAEIFENEVPGLVTPYPPQTNQFHLRFQCAPLHVEKALLRCAEETSLSMSPYLWQSALDSTPVVEVVVADSALKVPERILRQGVAVLCRELRLGKIQKKAKK